MTDSKVKIVIGAADNATATIRKIKDKFSSISGPVKEVNRSFKSVRKELEPLTKSAEKFSKSLKSMGMKTALGVGVPASMAAKSMFDLAADYEENMLRIEQVTKDKGGSLDELSKKFRTLAKDSRFQPDQIASGGMQLADANYSKPEISKIIPNTLNLATATGADMDLANILVASLTKAFGDKNEDIGESSRFIADQITALKQSSQVKINEQYKDALKNVVGYSVTQGIQFSDLNSAFAMLGDMMSEGGETGTALKIGIQRLVNPTTDAIKALKRMEVDPEEFLNSDGSIKGFGAIIKAFSEVDAKVYAPEFSEIFGSESSSKWLSLFHQGYEKYKVFHKAQLESTKIDKSDPENLKLGAAADAAEPFKKSSKGQALSLGSSISELKLAFADAGFLSDITDGIGWIKEKVDSLSESNPGLLKTAGNVTALVTAFGGLAVGGAVAIKTLSAWAPALAVIGFGSKKNTDKLVDGARKGRGAVKRLSSGFGSLVKDSGPKISKFASKFYSLSKSGIGKGAQYAFTRLKSLASGIAMVGKGSLALLTNPVFLGFAAVTAGIAGAAYLVYRNWDKVGPVFSKAGDYISDFFGNTKKIFSEVIDYLLTTPDKIAKKWQDMIKSLKALGNDFKDLFSFKTIESAFDWSQKNPDPEPQIKRELGLSKAIKEQEKLRESVTKKEIQLNVSFRNPPKGMIKEIITNGPTEGLNLNLGATL